MEEEETLRVRLVFEDRHILSKTQKKEGLKRSWILLKPQHNTISDFASHILHTFHLQSACPHGLIVSMDGFALPPFESICILKDKDIISVKKKGGVSSEIIKVNDGLNSLEEIDIVEKQHVLPVVKLLANEEFDKESGGYESELEEDEPEQLEYVLDVEDTSVDNTVSKKRKASNKFQSSKRKKSKLATAEECSKDAENNVHKGKTGKSGHHGVHTKKSLIKKGMSSDVQTEPEKLSNPEIDEGNNNIIKSTPDAKRSRQRQENGKGSGDVSQTPDGTKKLPSRNARRKKAKRKWLREQAKIEKKELHLKQLLGEDNQQLPGNDNHKVSEEHQRTDQLCDVEDEIVPIEVRPGHIRFEPLSEVGAKSADQAVKKNEIPVETFHWNGITSKKKGQKWGKEKTASSKRNDYRSSSQECSQMLTVEVETSANGHMDYDNLAPYSSLPKEGDIIAYRLIELSWSWTPELSSFRIGKISWYNAESDKIMLVPVPEYPLEKKMDEEASERQPDTPLYKEDGSLEIEFSSLADVRIVKHGNSNTATSVIDKISLVNQDSKSFRPNNNDEVHAPSQVSGQVNAWEEISQALSAKKAQLSQDDGWSNKDTWAHKGLRGSALGPTMAFLRAQNGL